MTETPSSHLRLPERPANDGSVPDRASIDPAVADLLRAVDSFLAGERPGEAPDGRAMGALKTAGSLLLVALVLLPLVAAIIAMALVALGVWHPSMPFKSHGVAGKASAISRDLQIQDKTAADYHRISCSLWAVGYRDDAIHNLSEAVLAGDDIDWNAKGPTGDRDPCVADAPARYGIEVFDSQPQDQLVFATPPSSDTFGRRLLEELHTAKPTKSGRWELMVAACLNERASLHYSAWSQLVIALNNPDDGTTTPELRGCLDGIWHAAARNDVTPYAAIQADPEIKAALYVPFFSDLPSPVVVELPRT